MAFTLIKFDDANVKYVQVAENTYRRDPTGCSKMALSLVNLSVDVTPTSMPKGRVILQADSVKTLKIETRKEVKEVLKRL